MYNFPVLFHRGFASDLSLVQRKQSILGEQLNLNDGGITVRRKKKKKERNIIESHGDSVIPKVCKLFYRDELLSMIVHFVKSSMMSCARDTNIWIKLRSMRIFC